MKVKCKIIKQVYGKNGFYVYGAVVLDGTNLKMNKYGNVSINSSVILDIDTDLTLELEQSTNPKYQDSYSVKSVLEYDVSCLTDETELEFLKKITTSETIANNIHNAYPNFIRRVLEEGIEWVDLKKIKGVGEVRIKIYEREINTKFKYFSVMSRFKEYNLTIKESKAICEKFKSLDEVYSKFEENPYLCLIDYAQRDFEKSDCLIVKVNDEFRLSFHRTEYMLLWLLGRNELDGNTKLPANDLAFHIRDYAPELLKLVKDVAVKSDLIYFDEETKDIAKMSTYIAECTIAEFVKKRVENPIKLECDWGKYKEINDGVLTEEQSLFLKQCCEQSLSLMDAPAGTGKSSTLKALLDMYDDYNISYTLVSATGRASQRITEATGRSAMTIHRATGLGFCEKTIDTDVVLCDEFGMVSVELMVALIRATNDNTRFVMIGDTYQLASFNGNVFDDMVNSNMVNVNRLTKVFRFGENGLATVSTMIRKGEMYVKDIVPKIEFGKGKEYTLLQSNGSVEQVVDEYNKMLSKGVKTSEIAVISPRNIGEFGVVNINNKIQALVNPVKKGQKYLTRKIDRCDDISFRKNDQVMITKNNYNTLTREGYEQMLENTDLDEDMVDKVATFNGEIGFVTEVLDDVMFIKIGDKEIALTKRELNNVLLGYAGTIFKFQGSEFKYTIVLTLNQHSSQINNNLMYTASTRGKQKVVEIADYEAIENGISIRVNKERNTFLKELLQA